MALLDPRLEDEGVPVSAFEDTDDTSRWCLSIYIETASAAELQARVANWCSDAGLQLVFQSEVLPDKDWVAESLRELAPVRAGRFVIFGAHDRDAPRPHEIPVLMDANVAFGSGHHGTTAGCLDMFDLILKRRSFHKVLDMGTGSGILAIAAAKAIQAPVLATDIDPVAVDTARENGRRNGVQALITCKTAPGFNHPEIIGRSPFDLIFANILAKPLQRMAPHISQHLAPGGNVILSGLLPHQKSAIVSACRLQNLMLRQSHLRDGWLTLVMEKPA